MPDPIRSPLARVLAAFAGVALVLAFLWGLLWLFLVVVVSAQLPDPSITDGDPCCGHPDTWRQVAEGLSFAGVMAVALALMLSAGVGLLRGAAGRDWLVRRRFVAWTLAGTLVGVVVASSISFGSAALARKPTDCATFTFRQADWRSDDDDVHRRTAYGIAECSLVDGLTAAQLVRMLGEPYEKRTIGRGPYATPRWHYDHLAVDFDFREHDRASGANAGSRDEMGS